MLGGECIWCCLHFWTNPPPKTSNPQGHLYHNICLCPQSNLAVAKKDKFYDEFHPVVTKIPTSEILILWGGWNDHNGKSSAGYEGVRGGHGGGTRNTEGESLLEVVVSSNLVIGNTCFKDRPNHQITYTLGEGLWMTWCSFVKPWRDRQATPPVGLWFPCWHPSPAKKKFVPRLRTWRFREPEAQTEYQKASITETASTYASGSGTEGTWEKSSLLKAVENVCESTKKHLWRKETWWWNAAVDSAVKENRECWKTWKKGGSKEEYQKPSTLSNMLSIW